ncbi:peptide chain release factor N(5)-glutamine methyltransferase [Williamsia sp.]|uniref:peptide chain release factor N(5)-glutamine methyltransferase n=1 Tax=Williamsia sp. TaxID=1872085 RepID=UPI002F92C0F0
MSARDIRRAAAAQLSAAGVPSAQVDAGLLLAFVLDRSVGELVAVDELSDVDADRYRELVDRRARREPLQHIIGHVAFGPIELEVGPGVFIPRMETELLYAWALTQIAEAPRPVVVDLCSGSGTLALALAVGHPGAVVHAVEIDAAAHKWLCHNLSRMPDEVRDRVVVHLGDAADPQILPDVLADLVVSNPPYIPEGADLPAEVSDHDPARALFGGADGMAVITPMISVVVRLLRPGGAVGIEHDDTTAALVTDALEADGHFDSITQKNDLAERARFVTAMRR